MLPTPDEVYQTQEQAREVLVEVAAKLRAGEWRFNVPHVAMGVVLRSLEAAGWNVRTIYGSSSAAVSVSPRSKEQNDLLAFFDDMKRAMTK